MRLSYKKSRERSTVTQPSNHKILIILLSITWIGVFPLDVILPSFPALADHFSEPIENISLSLSIFVAGFSLAQLLIGPLSDTFGRKRLLLAGMCLAIIGATGAMLTQNFFSFLIFRILQALGCGCFVLVNALIQDFYENSERHKIRIFTTTAGGLFISTAPLLGTALHLIGGWRGSFIFFVVSSSFIIFTAWRWIPKDFVKDTIGEHRGFYATLKIATNIDFIKYSVLSAIGFSCHFAFIVQSPIIFFEGFSLSQGEFSIVLLSYGIAYLVGGLIAKTTSNKISSRAQVIVGLLTVLFAGTLVSLSALIFPNSSIGILASMIICTCGITILRPAATTLAMEASPLQAGATSSFHNTIIFLMGAAISIAVTLAPLRPILNLSVTIMTLSLVGLTMTIFLTARRNRRAL